MADLKNDLAALRIEREPDRHDSGRWVGWVVLLVILAGGGFAAWRWTTRERPVAVEIVTVSERWPLARSAG